MLLMLGQVQRQAQEMAMSLQGANLVTEEGRYDAVKKQGLVEGLLQAIEVMVGPVKETDDEATVE